MGTLSQDEHAHKFDALQSEYNFVLGIEHWLTSDLVSLAGTIDAELQKRTDENNLRDSLPITDDYAYSDEEEEDQ